MHQGHKDYVTRVFASPMDLPDSAWDSLVDLSPDPSPYVRHAYLAALHESACARQSAGWLPQFFTLWRGDELQAACPLYLKGHSYGEYVFDWAWADAYARHGLRYYPKAVVAVPFTPVPGARLLARDEVSRQTLLQALVNWCDEQQLSSLHLLFLQEADQSAARQAGLLLRTGVQFHWTNPGHRDFEQFLQSLQQDKRKKIRQERRKVAEAGVRFRHAMGEAIADADWDFFYRCYEQTYREHGNPPYLNRDFFQRMAREMPQNWLLFVAEHDGQPIASSLIGLDPQNRVAYGRYWGALQRVDSLHFDACYYQPIEWCIAHGYRRFEGGAQGEHKMARALLPVLTHSAHWLAHPDFAEAVERYLSRETAAMDEHLATLRSRSPVKQVG